MRPGWALALAVSLAACVDLSRPIVVDAGGTETAPPDRPAPVDTRDTAEVHEPADTSEAAPADAEIIDGNADVEPAPDVPVAAPDLPAEAAPEHEPPVDLAPADLATDMGVDMAAAETTTPGLTQGAACTSGATCASGNCVDGVCCASACTQPCHACNRAGMLGVCAPEPAGTTCGAGSCTAGVETPPPRCDGTGQCVPAANTSCAPYACYMSFCGSACITAADCQAPYTCSANVCVSPGLILRWSFDEESGNTAQDSSGANRHGTAIGAGTSRPQPTTDVAPLKFPNPRSRNFVASNDHGVVAPGIPAEIKASGAVTMAAWFRVRGPVVAMGADIVAIGRDITLRINSDRIEWRKRKGTTAGQIFAFVEHTTTAHLDGGWHHLAGTSDGSGLKLYLDGMLVGSMSNGEPALFTTQDFIGAGHQPGYDGHEHTGEIDDVRIYSRVLSAAEIALLAAGHR